MSLLLLCHLYWADLFQQTPWILVWENLSWISLDRVRLELLNAMRMIQHYWLNWCVMGHLLVTLSSQAMFLMQFCCINVSKKLTSIMSQSKVWLAKLHTSEEGSKSSMFVYTIYIQWSCPCPWLITIWLPIHYQLIDG